MHEMMHATVVTYAQNHNRWIGDLAKEIHKCEQRGNNRLYIRKTTVLDVYQPEACKILARTVRIF
jgi:hypothetical protein